VIEAQSIVHDVGQKHLKDLVLGLDDGNTSLEKLSPSLFLNFCDKMKAESTVVTRALLL
jgi:hypothetical protein